MPCCLCAVQVIVATIGVGTCASGGSGHRETVLGSLWGGGGSRYGSTLLGDASFAGKIFIGLLQGRNQLALYVSTCLPVPCVTLTALCLTPICLSFALYQPAFPAPCINLPFLTLYQPALPLPALTCFPSALHQPACLLPCANLPVLRPAPICLSSALYQPTFLCLYVNLLSLCLASTSTPH